MSVHYCSTSCSALASNPDIRGYEEPDPVPGARWVELGHGEFALVDEEDFERVSLKTWRLQRGGKYAVWLDSAAKTYVYLHRFVMNAPDGVKVDHVHGNKLDCRKGELRLAATQQNAMNQQFQARVGKSSRFKGVSWHKGGKKWLAYIKKDYKMRSLGLFADEEAAARAYDSAAREAFGEFARLNFPEPGEHGIDEL